MIWLLRLLFIRLLGRRAVAVLAVLGAIAAIRGARANEAADVDPATGRVRLEDSRSLR